MFSDRKIIATLVNFIVTRKVLLNWPLAAYFPRFELIIYLRESQSIHDFIGYMGAFLSYDLLQFFLYVNFTYLHQARQTQLIRNNKYFLHRNRFQWRTTVSVEVFKDSQKTLAVNSLQMHLE